MKSLLLLLFAVAGYLALDERCVEDEEEGIAYCYYPECVDEFCYGGECADQYLFTQDPPFHDRPLPDPPEEQGIRYDLYTQMNQFNPESYAFDEWDLLLQNSQYFDNQKTTMYMYPGWNPSFPREEAGKHPEAKADDYRFSDVKNALLERYDMNVFLVSWSDGAGYYNYARSASNARVTGACGAQWVNRTMGGNNHLVQCMGHSLGGQACGYFGHFTAGTIGRVTGLDPAGPWFDKNESYARIDRNDAHFVDNIYTNVNYSLITLGLGRPVGHADFWPNGGGIQPGCEEQIDSFYCSHRVPTDFYFASINCEDCRFYGTRCNSFEDLEAGECRPICNDGLAQGQPDMCHVMGYWSEAYWREHGEIAEGTYYLETVEPYPYCDDEEADGNSCFCDKYPEDESCHGPP